jgi:hypothetical protein
MASADFTPSAAFPNASTSAPASDAARTLERNLDRLAARRNALLVWRSIARALAWGIGVAVLMIVAYRFYMADGTAWMPAIPIFVALLIGWRNGLLARGTTFTAALEADEKLDLKEHLSSALAFARPDAFSQKRVSVPAKGILGAWRTKLFPRPATQSSVSVAPTVLVPSLVEDAALRSQKLQPKEIYPLRFDRTHRVLALVVLHLLVAAFMPNVPWLLSASEQATRGNIANQGAGLVAVAKEIRKDEPKEAKENSESKKLARRMEALGQKMMRGRMGKKEALTGLGELKKDLEKAAKNDGQNQNAGADQKSMQQALQQLADQPMESEVGQKMQEQVKKGDLESAAKEMEKLADKMEKGELSESEKQRAASDMQKMAKSLKQQGGQQNEQMAQQLEQAAKALQQQGKKGNQQQNQQGQKGQGKQGQSGSPKQGQQQGSGQGASSALRQMAKSMRQSGSASNSQSLQKMLNKIREAENGTGSSGQSGAPGLAKLGQGNCPGGNCNGKTMTPGKDLKSSDPHGPVQGGAGLGPRNHAMGSKSGGGVSDKKSKRTGDKRRWEDVWSDRVPATHKKIDRVQGKYSDEGEMEQLPTKTEAKGGPVKTPYYEVYESYKKDAEDAVEKETVPPAYKQPVKDYFESIKPNQ